MKATLELPDDLYRMVKAKSALEGRSIRAVAIELFQRWLSGDERSQEDLKAKLRSLAGSVDSGIADLATNPAHLDGFGRRARDR